LQRQGFFPEGRTPVAFSKGSDKLLTGSNASGKIFYRGRNVMAVPLSDQIIQNIYHAAQLYHRLILVVAQTGAGKTAALQSVRDRTGAPLVNVNLELSRRMLELTERQRALQLPRLLREIVGNSNGEIILLDNLEIIFDVALKQGI
jgi:hypothetical protein